jgi:hypothetical protein
LTSRERPSQIRTPRLEQSFEVRTKEIKRRRKISLTRFKSGWHESIAFLWYGLKLNADALGIGVNRWFPIGRPGYEQNLSAIQLRVHDKRSEGDVLDSAGKASLRQGGFDSHWPVDTKQNILKKRDGSVRKTRINAEIQIRKSSCSHNVPEGSRSSSGSLCILRHSGPSNFRELWQSLEPL